MERLSPRARLIPYRLVVAALLAGLVTVLAASPAGAVVTHRPGRRPLGLVLPAGGGAARFHTMLATREAGGGSASVSYHGGPVLHTVAPYLVYWDPAQAIPASWRGIFSQYLSDVARASGSSDNVYAVERQYSDSSGYAEEGQAFDPRAQSIDDTQRFPSNACHTGGPIVACISDDQVGAELTRLIAARHLPTGVGASTPLYIVVLPPSVNECVTSEECATGAFCGYHSYTTSDHQPVLYAVLPTVSLAPGFNAKDCQWDGGHVVQEPNRSPVDVVLSTLGHEEIETIANPLLSGWFQTSTGNEIADMCASAGANDPAAGTSPGAFAPLLGGDPAAGTAYNQTLGSGHYYLQSVWSNASGGCAMRPAPAALTVGFRATSVGTTTSVDPAASSSGQGYSSVTWSFGDGSRPIFTEGQPPHAMTHAFPGPGSYTVSLTLVNRLGLAATAHMTIDVATGTATASAPVALAAALPDGRHATTARRRHITSTRANRRRSRPDRHSRRRTPRQRRRGKGRQRHHVAHPGRRRRTRG